MVSKVIRDHTRVGQLAVVGVVKANGKRFDAVAGQLAHHAGNYAGVYPAGSA